MKRLTLRELLFLALCCDLGLLAKRLISPAANLVTEALRIPGGISTSFSLLFLVVACMLVPRFGCGLAMGFVQCVLSLAIGRVGSMGAYAPIAYTLPGLVIDLCFLVSRRMRAAEADAMSLSNALASLTAALTANILVFRLPWPVLLVYGLVAVSCGTACGLLAHRVYHLVLPAVRFDSEKAR